MLMWTHNSGLVVGWVLKSTVRCSRSYQIDPRYLNLSGSVAEGNTEDFAVVMTELTKHIYNYQGVDQGRIRTRSMLCHIYHHALHDRWFQARDLMLMSHLQESIQHSDVETQVSGGPLLWWAGRGRGGPCVRNCSCLS